MLVGICCFFSIIELTLQATNLSFFCFYDIMELLSLHTGIVKLSKRGALLARQCVKVYLEKYLQDPSHQGCMITFFWHS